jgi:hypothetical protein
MVGRLVPTQVGQVQVFVETLPPAAGSEQTAGRIEDAGRKVVEAFDRAQDAIVEIASTVSGSVTAMARRSVDPDTMTVEFGLSFTVKGDLVVVGSTAAASLKVTLSYDRDRATTTAPSPAAN